MSLENTNYVEDTNVIILNDENGNEVEFEFLDLIEHEGGEYIVLLPSDDESVVILKVEADEENDTENYIGLEDEELLMELFEIFKANNADIYSFSE